MDEAPRLTRSEDDRMIAGVCGGLAAHFGVDATLVRVGFVLLALVGAGGVVLYLALWVIVPRASSADLPPREAVRDTFSEGQRMAQDGAEAAKRGYHRLRGSGSSPDTAPPGGGADAPGPAPHDDSGPLPVPDEPGPPAPPDDGPPATPDADPGPPPAR